MMQHNPMEDPGVDTSAANMMVNGSFIAKDANSRPGPDMLRGRSDSKHIVHLTNIESIHSSQSMIAVEHENKGDLYQAQL